MMDRFFKAGIQEIHCALRAELLSEETRQSLPQRPELTYLFVNTESSLHTLGELITSCDPAKGPVLFTMADTVMLQQDFVHFINFCENLPRQENAVLLTEFVEDEKPLWAQVDSQRNVTKFGTESAKFVTSGMYFLQPEAMRLVQQEIASGTHKMRNFLSKLAESRSPIKSFVVKKTIDVDHPSDLEKAAQFLRGE